MEQLLEDLIKQLVGRTQSEAEATLARRGLRCRVREIDGEALMGTDDLNPYRANLKLSKGIVTEVAFY